MEELPRITGKISAEHEQKVREEIDLEREKYMEPMPGEMQKTPEDVALIEKVSSFIQQELEGLGIDIGRKLDPRQVHFFSREEYDKNIPQKGGRTLGGASALFKGIYINKSELSQPSELLSIFLHEALHEAAFSRTHFPSSPSPELSPLLVHQSLLKSGYHSYMNLGDTVSSFRVFNEAVTDQIVIDIFYKHNRELKKEFEIPKGQGVPINVQGQEVSLLKIIVEKIAQRNVSLHESEYYTDEQDSLNKEAWAVWTKIKKAYFSGNMMHLRDIDRVYGKGSLDFLSVVGVVFEGQSEPLVTMEEALQYFKTDDEQQRKNSLEELYKKFD